MLSVIMPVYNEAAVLENVIAKWVNVLSNHCSDFCLRIYNDGSKDQSLEVMKRCAQKYANIIITNKPNSGHGPSVLMGYRDACDSEWILQVDSDNEIDPSAFPLLWSCRREFDFLVARRFQRNSSFSRKMMSTGCRMLVGSLYGYAIRDINVPFRLMKVSAFQDAIEQIPVNTVAPNTLVTGVAALKKLRCAEFDIPYRFRTHGKASITLRKVPRLAFLSMWQLVKFRILYDPSPADVLLHQNDASKDELTTRKACNEATKL
ncbi:MAG: glycosyltransferase family 2 protein [Deltaproteobacteria bacterium]|nr:glycosyltransferase family 2 protein [Deltaproteobacteria bacterium]